MVSTSENALVKPEVYETKRIQLTSQILHIGSEVSKLSPFEYVQTSNRVYLPNQEALAKALYQRGKLQEYIRRIENREEITSLLKETFGDNWQNEKLDGQAIFPETGISRKWTEEKISDLRPMIRNGFGQLYIPGSSIKGAIRTAIAYHLLKHSPKQLSEIEHKLQNTIGHLKQKAKFADDHLFMDRLFSDFDLIYQDKLISEVLSGSNKDFMRAVHITDTETLLEQNLTQRGRNIYRNLSVVNEVVISSRLPNRKAKYRGSIYAEMIFNIKTQFTISLDLQMLSWFYNKDKKIPFNSVEDILNICREFAQDQWDYEHDYWLGIEDNFSFDKNLNFSEIRRIYEPEQCPYSLRIGWASGMPSTTINLLLEDRLREEIRDICGLKAPGFEAPKSRRTVIGREGESKFVLGWAKLKIL